MDFLIASITLSGALFALVLSVVSLVLHYVRRKETPEYTALSAQIRALDAELIDMMDKVKHWRNRDQVRTAREKSEAKLSEAPDPSTPAEIKQALRRKATAAGMGIR
ncbi:MAG: hypothetical protein V3S55_15645 [Nitrospiraceae bacterium]